MSGEAKVNPVTDYGKSKAMAEHSLMKICQENGSAYTVYRFAPVYTDDIKRDIQKRYYLNAPDWAYIIGDGIDYEFLHIDNAVKAMTEWIKENPYNNIINIKDADAVNTKKCIQEEKNQGKAKHILKFPMWLILAGYTVIKAITGENKYTYLLHKAIKPIRTK